MDYQKHKRERIIRNTNVNGLSETLMWTDDQKH